MADKALYELASVLSNDAGLNDLVYFETVDEHSDVGFTTKNISAINLARAILNRFTFSELDTTAKTIIGALNEIAQGGGGGGGASVIVGTTTPTSSQGSNNDIYVKYSTLGGESAIVAVYVKISGAWLEVPLGGGSGSTVSITPTLATGTKIADYEIDGVSGSLYAPNGGGGSSALSDLTDVSITDPTEGQILKYKAIPNTETASGSVANFTTSLALPLVECKAQIVPIQEGTGDPSPSNPRAISGFNAVNVTRCGTNVWDEQWELGIYNSSTGEKIPSSSQIRCKNPIRVNENTTYFFKTQTASDRVLYYDFNGNLISSELKVDTTFTTPNGCAWIRFHCGGSYGTTYKNDVSINYPSTDTTYHSYSSGNTYEIDLDGTVYGGELDVKRGVLKVTHGIVSLASLTWTNETGQVANGLFRTNVTSFTPAFKWQGQLESSCFKFNATQYATIINDGEIALTNSESEPLLRFRWENWAAYDNEQVQAALGDAVLVYELATPTEITLTPEEITALVGVNNIWADSGDIEVEYVASFSDSWENANAGGGSSDIFIIHTTGLTTIDKSESEILAAIAAKTPIILIDEQWLNVPTVFTFYDKTGLDEDFFLYFGSAQKERNLVIKIEIFNHSVYNILRELYDYESPKYATGTLTAGSTSLTLTNSNIASNKTFDFYTSIFGVNPTTVSISGTSMTLTFEAQQTDMSVKVRIT